MRGETSKLGREWEEKQVNQDENEEKQVNWDENERRNK